MRYGECFTQEIFVIWFLRSAEKMHPAGTELPAELLFSLFTAAFLYLSFDGDFLKIIKYTILQNERMWMCRVLPPPPSIVFERLQLPQQIIYNVAKEIY